mgnify:CR=1 FL=1
MNDMDQAKKFAFDVGFVFSASVIGMLLGFVITIILARYLGAEDLGLYRMSIVIFGIVTLFTTLGIPAAIVKYVAEDRDDIDRISRFISSGIITVLILSLVLSIILYMMSKEIAKIFEMPKLAELLKILSIVFPFASINQVMLGLLNGLREMKKYATSLIIQSVLMVIIAPILIFHFGVVGAVIGFVSSTVLTSVFLIWICRRYFYFTFEEYKQIAKRLLKFGSQVFSANAINWINYRADMLMIGYFLTATHVGYYAVAVSLSRFFWIIPNAIQRVTYPVTSEYWVKNDHTRLQKMINMCIKISTCILLPLGLIIGFFAEVIIVTIFGDKFIYSVLPLQLLLIGTIIDGSTTRPIGASLASIGRPDLNLKIVSISCLLYTSPSPRDRG